MTILKPIEIATNKDIKVETREVYVVRGANRAYLSESGALNKLAYVRAQEQFDDECRQSNYPLKEVKQEDGTIKLMFGEMRPDFILRHSRILNELQDDIKKEKEFLLLKKEHAKKMEEHKRLYDELMELDNKLCSLQTK
ncbi:hypothetical protein J8V57_09570 [Xenorhabdus sp. PB61.4]|uniref:hypothetical protein n=1 Tax=Xenorhabdus sp. PB61.4 TaxID=2788940 RepID=UPI001E2F4C30|nr:hypothetical protein [Xenorhabdus sp. PB61.4]MCC8366528.1 hypothetical protein [Xenorhabdus sp. PB61.4]